MKIFFRRILKTLFITGLSAIFISCTGKAAKTAEKSAVPRNGNSLSQAFMKAQSSKQSEKSAADRITFNKEIAIKDTKSKVFTEIKARDAVREMKAGWNLGNTLDATDYTPTGSLGSKADLSSEISWGQPYTTKAMIDGLAASGIKTLRIPISWSRHIIDPDYTIDPAWMSRVKEIVDWALEDGLYVIINIHHDNFDKNQKMPPLSGFYPTEENYENSANFVCNIWAQISLAFNNGYDQHLIFEALNEPRLCGTSEEWYYNTKSEKSLEAMKTLNKLNQNILDVIRDSDGNNKKRLLAFPSLQASPDSAFAGPFKMPQDYDLSTNRLILSVHMYTPYSFAMQSPGIREYSDSVKKEFTSIFQRLNDTFISKGYAVYIGEYGATNKNNLKDRVTWFGDFNREANAFGMSCILWDNGVWKVENDDYNEHYGFYNREQQTWYFPEILEAINN